MAEVTCSFCGRSKKDVDLMISGIHAHICDKCITQAQQILTEEGKSTPDTATPQFNLEPVQPAGFKNHQQVAGQIKCFCKGTIQEITSPAIIL